DGQQHGGTHATRPGRGPQELLRFWGDLGRPASRDDVFAVANLEFMEPQSAVVVNGLFGSLRGSWRQGHAGLGKLPTVELERQPPPSMVSEGTASPQQHLITNLGNIAIKPAVAVGKTCPVKENVRPSSRQARNGRTERLPVIRRNPFSHNNFLPRHMKCRAVG